MADDEFVSGFTDSEWTGIAPLLEEDVAISSIAQDELGHARALYQLLVDVVDDGRDEDALAYDREPDEYRHARLLDHAARRLGRHDRPTLPVRARRRGAPGLDRAGYRPLAELVEKLKREERYHRMHVLAWIDRLARGGREARRRIEAALVAQEIDAPTVFTPLDGEAALLEAGILTRSMADAEAAWRADLTTILVPLELALPPHIPLMADGRRGPFRQLPLAMGRVHLGSPVGGPGRVVMQAPTQTRQAAAPPGCRHARPSSGHRRRSRTCRIPEIPAVSIVELGMVGEVEVGRARHPRRAAADVRRLPRAGDDPRRCRAAARRAGRPVQVDVSFATPWTSDRISPEGREKLRVSGFAPPPHLRAGRALPMLDMLESPAATASPGTSASPGAPLSDDGRPDAVQTPCPARTAAPRERRSRTSSGRRSADRSTTARTAGNRSRRSSPSSRPRIPQVDF